MNTMLATIRKTSAAAVIAVAIGVTAFSAAPVMAQSGPSLNFQLELGGGSPQAFGSGPSAKVAVPDEDYEYFCLSDRDIRHGLREYGFRDVRITRELKGDRVEVIARYSKSWYSMRVDRCTGEVDRVKKIRKFFGYGY